MTTDRLLTIGLIAVLVIACAGLAIVGALLIGSRAIDALQAIPADLQQTAQQRGVAVCAGVLNLSSCNIAQTSTNTTPAPADEFDVWDWLLLLFGGIVVIIVLGMTIGALGLGNEAPR